MENPVSHPSAPPSQAPNPTTSGTRCAFRPFLVVLAGPPGSGKTSALRMCIERLINQQGGPPQSHYVDINPDYWITQLCDNNNAYRPVANFLNHETFLSAVAQRRHIIFDGTAKSVLNTVGRVISR